MLGLLLNGIMHCAAAIDKHRKDKDLMSSPMYYQNGIPVYMDSSRNKYMNGEKVVTEYDYTNKQLIEVGQTTRTIYHNPKEETEKRMKATYDVRNLENARKNGKFSCNMWHQGLERLLTTEISTGKIIACLYKDSIIDEYRKFYYEGNMNGGRHKSIETTPGDLGIVISKEEFEALSLSEIDRTYSSIPNTEIWHKLEERSKNIRKQQMVEKYDIPNIQKATKEGRLACEMWNERFRRCLLTEISTKKVLAYIYEDPKTKECRKFYMGEKQGLNGFDLPDADWDDYGVIISKDEYDKLRLDLDPNGSPLSIATPYVIKYRKI